MSAERQAALSDLTGCLLLSERSEIGR